MFQLRNVSFLLVCAIAGMAKVAAAPVINVRRCSFICFTSLSVYSRFPLAPSNMCSAT